jgi:sulfatase modifying factor 1
LTSAARSLSSVILVAALGCACAKDKPPTTSGAVPSTPVDALPSDASQPPADSHRPIDGGPHGWITFDRSDELRPSGPQWSFTTDGLPAISNDGTNVLVPVQANGVANYRLEVIGVSDGHVVATTEILGANELVATQTPDGWRPSLLTEVAARVNARVARANAELSRQGWAPFTECTNHDPPGSVQPPCSMEEQHITCGDLRILRRQSRLELILDGRTATVTAPEGAVRSVPSAGGPAVPVRSCLGFVWFDPARRLLLGKVDQECQGAGGDGCIVPAEWHLVRLPFASGPSATAVDAGAACKEGMVAVPGGSFEMGDATGLGDRSVHRETVASFCIDMAEVTVAGYAGCVGKRRCFAPSTNFQGGSTVFCDWKQAGDDKLPVNCVSWADADEYCRWVGKRLPTEVEWEYAARGSEGRLYPWGNTAPSSLQICWQGALDAKGVRRGRIDPICAAGSSPDDRTPLGVADLGGNVSEWTASPSRDPGAAPGARVIRGGGWSSPDERYVRSAHGSAQPPSVRSDSLGFRCAAGGR